METDIFDNRKIRQIESLPEGDAIIVIWMKLLCLAGKINDYGMIYLTKEIPYTDQMLSVQFGKPLPTIQLSLNTFRQFEMIEIIDNIMCISNWEEYQNIEMMEKVREQTRKRVAKFREKKKIECNVTETLQLTLRNATDRDRDKDRESDKESDKEIDDRYTNPKSSIINLWKEITGKSIHSNNQYIDKSIKEYGIDYVIEAIEQIKNSDYLLGKTDHGIVVQFAWFYKHIKEVHDGKFETYVKKQKEKKSEIDYEAFEDEFLANK